MAETFDIPDPSDWHDTRLPSLSTIDSGLRCQICKEFYTSAVITSCEHTFCSICIRRSLATDGHCPTCRTVELETKLRKNVAVQELVDIFTAARPSLLKVAKEIIEPPEEEAPSRRGSKRKRRGSVLQDEQTSEGRQTRSQKRRLVESGSQAESADMTAEDLKDGDYTPEDTTPAEPAREQSPDDGLVPCPICQKRMKAESVYAHLDTCEQELAEASSASANPRSKSRTPLEAQPPSQPAKPPPERLPQLSYSLLNEQSLRKKLNALGIPTWGGKPLLERRHTEWINLWNANCDSARPSSKKELLSQLDVWERTQGGRAVSGAQSNAVMNKDFDGKGWVTKNKTSFDNLIAEARKRSVASPATSTEGGGPESSKTPPAAASDSNQQRPSMTTSSYLPNGASIDDTNHNPPTLTQQPSQSTAEATSLPARLGTLNVESEGVKTMHMFEVPRQPVLDSDDTGRAS